MSETHRAARRRSRTWAVVGGTGFVGRAVVREAESRGLRVRVVAAPRWLADPSWSAPELLDRAELPARLLRPALTGCDVVVNAAGLATPGARRGPLLAGANALLPAVVVAAAPVGARVLHVSSAAVQGSRPVLDDSEDVSPESPYAESKAVGERAARAAATACGRETVVLRATSVQGPGRATTESLRRFARSPFAVVAGDGTAPVPVTSVWSLARLVVDLGAAELVPRLVLQPWEGWTNGELLRVLGGKPAHRVPVRWAERAVRVAERAASASGGCGASAVRRVELVLLGQAQRTADRGGSSVTMTRSGHGVTQREDRDRVRGRASTAPERRPAASREPVRLLHRSREVSVNVGLLVGTAVVHLAEDPLRGILQGSRRLPAPVLRMTSGALLAGRSTGLRAAVALWLAGRPDQADRVLDGLPRPRSAVGRRLAAELTVQLDRPDRAAVLDPAAPASLRARAAWLQGDLSRAVAELGADGTEAGLLARYRSHLDLLQAGRRLAAPTDVAGAPKQARPGLSAFHVLTNSLPHTRSGYAYRSHSVLTAQAAAGIRVAAATRVGYPVTVGVLSAAHEDRVDGVRYLRTMPRSLAPTASARLQQQVDLLARAVADVGPQVLHTTTDFTNALVTEALARRFGLPWVYEVRGLLEETWVAAQAGDAAQDRAAASERYGLHRAKETEMAMSADHVVTLSRTLREELVQRGVAAADITVVPNAVDPALLRTSLSAADARDLLGLPRQGFWVGTVSSLVDYEGLDTLLDAVAALRRRGVDARACVVGDGVVRPALEARAQEVGLGAHAVFPGRVPQDRAALHHQALDVFAVPRRDVRVCRQVTPLKPIEAMACARPVVASDLPALAEVVHEPGAGLLAPAGDAEAFADVLQELATDPGRRAELGAVGRSFASSRTWAHAGRAYRELYGRLAGVTA